MSSGILIIVSGAGLQARAGNAHNAHGPIRPYALAKGIARLFSDHEVVGSAAREAMVRFRVSGGQQCIFQLLLKGFAPSTTLTWRPGLLAKTRTR